MSKKYYAIMGMAGVFAVGVLVWQGSVFSKSKAVTDSAPVSAVVRPVPTVVVQGVSDCRVRQFPGKVRANRRVKLAFSVPGLLEELNCQEGRRLEKGEVLARLDRRDYQHMFDAAQAKCTEAQRAFERYRSLREKKVVCDSDYEKVEAACDIARAELRMRTKELKDTVLLAPFDGVVSRRYVENHEHVQAKQPILLFQDISLIEVVIQMPERLIAHGGAAGLRKLKVHFDADGGRWFDATIREFSVQSDVVTRTYDVVVGLKPPMDMEVLPGMTATVKAEIASCAERVRLAGLVPAEAVWSETDGKSYVWVVPAQGGKPEKLSVEIGAMRKDGVEILSGVQPGQHVAVAGLHALREGVMVRPMIAGKEGLEG